MSYVSTLSQHLQPLHTTQPSFNRVILSLNRFPPCGKSNSIWHMGAYPNLKPTYPLFLLRTSWSSIPCSDHSPFVIQTLGIPNHVDWAISSRYTKASTCIFAPRALNVPKQVVTLNQPINCHIILQNGTMTSYIAQPRHP